MKHCYHRQQGLTLQTFSFLLPATGRGEQRQVWWWWKRTRSASCRSRSRLARQLQQQQQKQIDPTTTSRERQRAHWNWRGTERGRTLCLPFAPCGSTRSPPKTTAFAPCGSTRIATESQNDRQDRLKRAWVDRQNVGGLSKCRKGERGISPLLVVSPSAKGGPNPFRIDADCNRSPK